MQTAQDFLNYTFLGLCFKSSHSNAPSPPPRIRICKNLFVDDITNYNLIMINLFVIKVFGAPSHQGGRVHQVALSQVGLTVEHEKLPKLGRVEDHDVLVL